jgi:hypothetical protein
MIFDLLHDKSQPLKFRIRTDFKLILLFFKRNKIIFEDLIVRYLFSPVVEAICLEETKVRSANIFLRVGFEL